MHILITQNPIARKVYYTNSSVFWHSPINPLTSPTTTYPRLRTHKTLCLSHIPIPPPISCTLRQRERDAREARQLDREIRAQERHYHQAETRKQQRDTGGKLAAGTSAAAAAADAVCAAAAAAADGDPGVAQEVHTQFGQSYQAAASSSERTSSASTPPARSPRDSIERHSSGEQHHLPSYHQHPSPAGGEQLRLLSRGGDSSGAQTTTTTTSESARDSVASTSRKVSAFVLVCVCCGWVLTCEEWSGHVNYAKNANRFERALSRVMRT